MTVIAKATTKYPRGNDDAPSRSSGGQVSGDMSEEAEEVYTDASLLDEKVRQLIQSAGANYNITRAVENGTLQKIEATDIPDELYDAMQRLEKAAPIINAAVAHMNRRAAHGSPLARLLMGKAAAAGSRSGSPSGSSSGSASGSQSGSTSGSESGSTSGEFSKTMVIRAMQGHVDDALRFMGRR